MDVYLESAAEIGGLLIAERDVLAAWAGEGPLNALDEPRLEFTAPKAQYVDTFVTSYRELLRMRAARPLTTPPDRGVWSALSYEHQGEQGNAPLADRLLFELAPCPPEEPLRRCPAVAGSGLYRRLLWRRAIQTADRRINAFLAHRAARQRWLGGAPLQPCEGGNAERALRLYRRAAKLADRESERRRLALRVEQLGRTAPDCAPRLAAALAEAPLEPERSAP